jgi:hypothetical protein
MGDLHVDMSVNDLASFLFIRNVDNKSISININEGGIQNTRDLFCFCLDLLFKGLILLYGEDNKVLVNALTLEQFDVIKRKLRCANIECHLEIIPLETPSEEVLDLWTQNFLNVHKVRNSDECLKLEDYHFDLQLSDCIYKIWFEIKYCM